MFDYCWNAPTRIQILHVEEADEATAKEEDRPPQEHLLHSVEQLRYVDREEYIALEWVKVGRFYTDRCGYLILFRGEWQDTSYHICV